MAQGCKFRIKNFPEMKKKGVEKTKKNGVRARNL